MRQLVRASALSGYNELVHELGADPTLLISRFNIDPDRIGDHDYLIFQHNLIELLEYSATVLACPDFGLRLSKHQNLETLGPIAIMARTSNNLREAIFCIARYFSFHSPAMKLSLDEKTTAKFSRVVIELNSPDFPNHRQTMELSIGLMASIHTILSNKKSIPEAILFHHSRSLDSNYYKRHFGCPVLFGQDCNAIILTQDKLDIPLITADSIQRDMISSYVIKKGGSAPTTITEQTRFLIRRLIPTQCCTIDNVAHELSMHKRTLQRRLKEHGLVFESLVDDFRRGEAENFLAEKNLSMAQIAGLLGYQEQSSFNRAVKRWFGVSPNAYRKLQHQQNN
ncbi:MAG: AraC-like DNA-binding protein [Zhongshania sp.]|jgi:AraC-like DNA-binding protein